MRPWRAGAERSWPPSQPRAFPCGALTTTQSDRDRLATGGPGGRVRRSTRRRRYARRCTNWKAPSVRPELAGPLLGANRFSADRPDSVTGGARRLWRHTDPGTSPRAGTGHCQQVHTRIRHPIDDLPSPRLPPPQTFATERKALARVLGSCCRGGCAASCAPRNTRSRGISQSPGLSPDFPQSSPGSPEFHTTSPQVTHRATQRHRETPDAHTRRSRPCQ